MFGLFEMAQNSRLIYLTRFGTPPSEYSRKKKGGGNLLPLGQIQCISWAEDIYRWLEGELQVGVVEGSFGAGYLNGSDRTVGHPRSGSRYRTKRYIPVREDGYIMKVVPRLYALYICKGRFLYFIGNCVPMK